MWNKDEIKGKGKQISGAIKDKAGELIKDPKLEAKGEAERVAGKLQEKSGKARRKTGEAVQKARQGDCRQTLVHDSWDGFCRSPRWQRGTIFRRLPLRRALRLGRRCRRYRSLKPYTIHEARSACGSRVTALRRFSRFIPRSPRRCEP